MRRQKRKRKVQDNYENGLCACSKGCSGFSLEFRDDETLCLYVHTQRNTMSGQSTWLPLEDVKSAFQNTLNKNRLLAGSIVLARMTHYETRLKKHKQLCGACRETPETNYYRFRIGNNSYQTLHKKCLEKIINLSEKEILDMCYRSTNAGTKNKAITLMSPEQRKEYGISDSKVKILVRTQKKKKLLNDINEEEFLKWRETSTVVPFHEFRHSDITSCGLEFTGKYNGIKLQIRLTTLVRPSKLDPNLYIQVLGQFGSGRRKNLLQRLVYERLKVNKDLILLCGAAEAMDALEGKSYEELSSDQDILSNLELFSQKTYNAPMSKSTAALMMTSGNNFLARMAEQYMTSLT